MITLKEGKPQDIEISVSYQGLPYEKEVSFGVLADGAVAFQQEYEPKDGKIDVIIPALDSTKEYTYVMETDDGFTKPQPLEVYAPKMRDIAPKKQFLDVDIDQARDQNTEQLLGAADELYSSSKGKIDEIEKSLGASKQENQQSVDGVYNHILEDIVPLITQTKDELLKAKDEYTTALIQQSDRADEISDNQKLFGTKSEIDQKVSTLYRDVGDVRKYADEIVKPLIKEIKSIKTDTSLQDLGKNLTVFQEETLKELGKLKRSIPMGGIQVQPSFSTIAVSGQTSLNPRGVLDTLTLVGSGGTTITTNSNTNTVTIAGGGGGGTPGGNDTNIQYNDSGAFAGSDKFTWNNTTNTLKIGVIGSSSSIKGISGGSGTDENGTSLNLYGGDGDGTGDGGNVTLTGGYGGAGANGNGGSISLIGGETGGSGANGFVFLSSGNQNSSIYVEDASPWFINQAYGTYRFYSGAGAWNGIFDFFSLSTNRTYTWPDQSGTVAMLSDITGGTPGGSDTQLQFNDGGVFGGIGGSERNKTNLSLYWELINDNSGFEVYAANGAETEWSDFQVYPQSMSLQNTDGVYETGFSFDSANKIAGFYGKAVDDSSGGIINILPDEIGQFSFTPYGTTGQAGILDFSQIDTSDKTFTFPNTTGTIALTSDITGGQPFTTVTDSGTTLTLVASLSTIKTYVFTGSSDTVWTLPALSGNTDVGFLLKNRGTANITLTRAGSDNIYAYSSVTSFAIYPGEAYQVVNDGSYRLLF